MRVELRGSTNGWSGTSKTIREMRRLVRKGKIDPTVIWTAQQLARKVDRKDYAGQARAIFNFVRRYIHYVRDPKGVELLRSPFQVLHYRAGDCDDQAILFSALAEAIGLSTRFKTIKANIAYPSEFSHVYSQVEIPGRGWMSADTIVPRVDLGWEAKHHFGSQVWEGSGMGALPGLASSLTDYHYRSVPKTETEAALGVLEGRAAEQVLIMTRAAMQKALQPYWKSSINRWMFEVYRRVKNTTKALKEKKKPQYIKGPPPGLAQAASDLTVELEAAVISEIPGGALVTAIDNIFKSSSAKTATSKAKFYLNAFRSQLVPAIQKHLGELLKEFVRAGGMVPIPPGVEGRKPELALGKYMDKWWLKSTGTLSTQPHRGWTYVTLERFRKACKKQIAPMKEAADILGVAYKASIDVAGDAAEVAGEKVAEALVARDVITQEEAAPAAEIAKKVAQGYALTPEELPLAEKMGVGIRQAEAVSAGKFLVPAAAAALAAKVLLL